MVEEPDLSLIAAFVVAVADMTRLVEIFDAYEGGQIRFPVQVKEVKSAFRFKEWAMKGPRRAG